MQPHFFWMCVSTIHVANWFSPSHPFSSQLFSWVLQSRILKLSTHQSLSLDCLNLLCLKLALPTSLVISIDCRLNFLQAFASAWVRVSNGRSFSSVVWLGIIKHLKLIPIWHWHALWKCLVNKQGEGRDQRKSEQGGLNDPSSDFPAEVKLASARFSNSKIVWLC